MWLWDILVLGPWDHRTHGGKCRYWRHPLTNQITGKSVLTNRRSVCQYCFHSRFIYLLGRTMGVWDPWTLGLLDCWTLGLGDLFTPPSSPHTSTYLLLSFPPTLVLFVMVCYGLIWFNMVWYGFVLYSLVWIVSWWWWWWWWHCNCTVCKFY